MSGSKNSWVDKFNKLKEEEPRMYTELKELEEQENVEIEELGKELEKVKNEVVEGTNKEEVMEKEETKKQKIADLEKKYAALQKGYNLEQKEDGKVSRTKTLYNKKKAAYDKFQKNKPQLENLCKLQVEEEAKLEKAEADKNKLTETRKTLEQKNIEYVKIISKRDSLLDEINQKGITEEKRIELYALIEEAQTNMRNVEGEKETLSKQVREIEITKPDKRYNNSKERLDNIKAVATSLLRGTNLDKIGLKTKQTDKTYKDTNNMLSKKVEEKREQSKTSVKNETKKATKKTEPIAAEQNAIAVSKPERFQGIKKFFNKIKNIFTKKNKNVSKEETLEEHEIDQIMEEAKKKTELTKQTKKEQDLLYVKDVAKYGKEEALVRKLQRESSRANIENAEKFAETKAYKDQTNIAQKYEESRRQEFLNGLQRNEGIENLQKRFEQKRIANRARATSPKAKTKDGR